MSAAAEGVASGWMGMKKYAGSFLNIASVVSGGQQENGIIKLQVKYFYSSFIIIIKY